MSKIFKIFLLAAILPTLTVGITRAQPFIRQDDQTVTRQSDQKPNILFILVDDLGWNGPGSYGDRYLRTPNIDRLANQGMKFTHFYVPSMCHPSRSELLSGEYGARTGMTEQSSHRIYPHAPLITPKHNPDNLPKNIYTIANMLRDAGYATMVSGKWNIADSYRAANLKKKYGDGYFKPYGFDYIGNAREKNWSKVDNDKADPAIVDDFFQFINHRQKQPFFAYLAFFAPHTPIQAPDSLVKKFVARGFPKSTQRFGDAAEKPTADYLAMIKYLDNWIGKLLDGLNKRGLAKNTLVVFSSDNGGMNRAWDNGPLRGAKGQVFDGGIRVPLLVRWPGHIAGGSCSAVPIETVDWFPTFQEIARGSIPGSKILDGASLLPLLTQDGHFHQRPLYFHRPDYMDDYGHTPSSAIITGHYKLIHYYGDYLDTRGYLPQRHKPYGKLVVGEKDLLFNIKKDPFERHDLSEKMPERTQALLDSLKDWLRRTHASVPIPNPAVDKSNWHKRARIKKSRKTKKLDEKD